MQINCNSILFFNKANHKESKQKKHSICGFLVRNKTVNLLFEKRRFGRPGSSRPPLRFRRRRKCFSSPLETLQGNECKYCLVLRFTNLV